MVIPPADEVVKEVYGGDREEPREGVVAIQGGGLPLDAGTAHAVIYPFFHLPQYLDRPSPRR